MAELCRAPTFNEILARANNKMIETTSSGDPQSMDLLLKKSDDQSIVTAPTVMSFEEDDDDCDHSVSGDDDSDSCLECVSVSSTDGLRCVSLNLVPEVHEIPNRHDYTDDEADACWYGRREKEVMREAAYGIAESLDYHYFHDEHGRPTSTNFRGLESYTIEGANERKLSRVKVLIAVLREQRRQRKCGEVVINGPELIRSACHRVSKESQRFAYLQARQDAREVDEKAAASPSKKVDESPNMLLQLTRLFRDMSGSSSDEEWDVSD